MSAEFELIVPCYNEAKNLVTLVDRAIVAAKRAGASPASFQLVVVQNGSSDNSSQILSDIKASDAGPWVRVVDVDPNQGYGFGIMEGLRSTSASIIGWTHADLQTDPADAFRAFEIVRSEARPMLVKGRRSGRDWKEQFISRIFELIAQVVLGLDTFELNAQPKIFRREELTLLRNPPKDFALDLYLVYQTQKNNLPIHEVEVRFPPRVHGVSNWANSYLNRYKTIWGMIKYMFKLLWSEGRA